MAEPQTENPVSVSLPVIERGSDRGRAIAKSKASRWRAGVLISIHILILLHIAQWLITGRTLSPVEPSESMETLELGKINAGFIMLSLAVLSTVVFGRFFCGWGCHLIALQDLCGWMMRKVGVRPKAFRSRLLVYVPVVLGFYMFLWPNFKRLVLTPALGSMGFDYPVWLIAVPEHVGFETELMVNDFWTTMPPWFIAIPFLVVTGFATVYFLGSKGFCTYACPYGGLFGPLDRVAVGRIRVNDSCEGCGHCTAACTSNVRVAEEVRDFGMVVSPGCMKTLDCVSVCPNDALSFSFGLPSAFAKPVDEQATIRRKKIKRDPKRYDLTWGEEVLFSVVYGGAFFGFRDMMHSVPMLFAAGIAGIVTFILFKLWSMARRPSVRLMTFQLRYKGKLTRAGLVYIVLGIGVLGLTAWGVTTKGHLLRARVTYASMKTPVSHAIRPDYAPAPDALKRALGGIRDYQRADSFSRGGLGWKLTPDNLRHMAYFQVVAGQYVEARVTLEEIVERGKPLDTLVIQLGQIMQLQGAGPAEILSAYQHALELHPKLDGIRGQVAMGRMQMTGEPEAGISVWEEAMDTRPEDARLLVQAASFFGQVGDAERSKATIERALELGLDTLSLRTNAAFVLMGLGEVERAVSLIQEGLDEPGLRDAELIAAASALLRGGASEEARQIADGIVVEDVTSSGTLLSLGMLRFQFGELEAGLGVLERAGEAAKDEPWDLFSVGGSLFQAGLSLNQKDALEKGLGMMRRASEVLGWSSTIQHDLALALFRANQPEEGLVKLQRAAELSGDAGTLRQLAEVLDQMGRSDEAQQWRNQADEAEQSENNGG